MANYTHLSGLNVQGAVETSLQGKLIGTFDAMPEASSQNEGLTILYMGPTGLYIQGKYYVSDGRNWSLSAANPTTTTVDSELSTTSTNPVQNKVITPVLNQLRTDIDNKAPADGTAAKAIADANGNNIVDTYETKANAITGLSVSGKVITYTKGNGTTGTITTQDTDNDTKNTAGSTDTSSKLFLIGATSQAANPQTYSHDTAYVGTDGKLYSGGKVVIASGDKVTSASTADSATKATQDGEGNTIASTYLPKSGGTMTGMLVAQNNTSYTTKQVRNIVLSTSEPTSSDGSDGDLWAVYE